MSHFGFIFESNRYPAATDNFISPIAFYNSSCNRSAIVSILTFGRPRRMALATKIRNTSGMVQTIIKLTSVIIADEKIYGECPISSESRSLAPLN